MKLNKQITTTAVTIYNPPPLNHCRFSHAGLDMAVRTNWVAGRVTWIINSFDSHLWCHYC